MADKIGCGALIVSGGATPRDPTANETITESFSITVS